jgi:hypothetical protein
VIARLDELSVRRPGGGSRVSGRTGNICGRNGKKPNERRGQINQMDPSDQTKTATCARAFGFRLGKMIRPMGAKAHGNTIL